MWDLSGLRREVWLTAVLVVIGLAVTCAGIALHCFSMVAYGAVALVSATIAFVLLCLVWFTIKIFATIFGKRCR